VGARFDTAQPARLASFGQERPDAVLIRLTDKTSYDVSLVYRAWVLGCPWNRSVILMIMIMMDFNDHTQCNKSFAQYVKKALL